MSARNEVVAELDAAKNPIASGTPVTVTDRDADFVAPEWTGEGQGTGAADDRGEE